MSRRCLHLCSCSNQALPGTWRHVGRTRATPGSSRRWRSAGPWSRNLLGVRGAAPRVLCGPDSEDNALMVPGDKSHSVAQHRARHSLLATGRRTTRGRATQAQDVSAPCTLRCEMSSETDFVLGFVRLATLTEDPHGAWVRRSKRHHLRHYSPKTCTVLCSYQLVCYGAGGRSPCTP